MYVLIIIFLFIISFLLLAITLPMKLRFHGTIGTDESLEFSTLVMLYNGFLGGGLMYRGKQYTVSIYCLSRRFVSFTVTPLIAYMAKKRAKPSMKKKPAHRKPIEPRTLPERIETAYRVFQRYRGYAPRVLREMRGIVRIDLFSAKIHLGLGSPALTGALTGLVFALNGMLPPPYSIKPSWSFTTTCFGGGLDIHIIFSTWRFWIRFFMNLPLILSLIKKRGVHQTYSPATSHATFMVQEV